MGPTASAGLLAAARGGDEDAFARLVEPHRRELHAHAPIDARRIADFVRFGLPARLDRSSSARVRAAWRHRRAGVS